MKFSELKGLETNGVNGSISPRLLNNLLPHTPEEINLELYSSHGKNEEFQAQYSELNIDQILWRKKSISAEEILNSECSTEFCNWMNNVSKWALRFEDKGWESVDARPFIAKYWKENKTWMKPPIFLDKVLLKKGYGIWLVEGHTRVGTLKGLVENSIIGKHTQHDIWIGS